VLFLLPQLYFLNPNEIFLILFSVANLFYSYLNIRIVQFYPYNFLFLQSEFLTKIIYDLA